MQVALITPRLIADDLLSRRVALQAWHFAMRGDEVVIYSATPPAAEMAGEMAAPLRVLAGDQAHELGKPAGGASDLYVFHGARPYPLMENLLHLERGATVLYFYAEAAVARAEGQANDATTAGGASTLGRLAACADLVVTESEIAAHTLVEEHGYTAMPVYVLPVNEQSTPGEYAVLWAEAVAAATAWLPNRPYPYGRLPALEELHPPDQGQRPAPTAGPNIPDAIDSPTLAAELEALATAAKTMQRGYVVRSRLPIVGPLIAWLRRNLTSHLREPYIDPTFQRQESFNRQAAQAVETLARHHAATVAALEERIAELERRAANPPDASPGETP